MKRSIRTKTVIAVAATIAALAILAAGCGDNGVNNGGRSEYLNRLLDVFSKNPGHNDDAGTSGDYTLTINASEGGTVTRSVNRDSYKAGTSVTVTAVPNLGYEFISWSGALNSTKLEITITMNGDRWLTANFKKDDDYRPMHDIFFDANGADCDVPAPARSLYGIDITLPDQASMERPGYRLVGWTEDNPGIGTFYNASASYSVTHNATLYAKWIPVYTVTFDGGYSAIAPVTADSGAVIRLPILSDVGYKGALGYPAIYFRGWSTGTDNYNKYDSYIVTGNVTLYARWNRSCEVIYVDIRNRIPIVNLPAGENWTYDGTVITLPGDDWNLEIDGYYFDGWCTTHISCTTGITYPAGSSYTVNEDVTFYAKWVVNPTTNTTHTVVFNGNGAPGSIVPNMVSNVNFGSAITLPDMAWAGYNFGGWNTKSDGTGTNYKANSSYTVRSDVTLYAMWTVIKKFTVTYNGNGVIVGVPEEVSDVDSGSIITLPDQGDMAKNGYNFGGWNTKSDGTGTSYIANSLYTVKSNVTLFAKWSIIKKYTVTYNGNGTNISVPEADRDIDSGSTIWLPDMERTGYNFGGWNTNSSGSGTNYGANSSYTVMGNVTLYAKWTIKTYTVTFDGNGATSNVPAAKSANYGSSITLPTMTRSGYSFGGWNTNNDGSGTNYVANSSYTITVDDITLYAKWIVVVVKGTIIDTRNSKTYRTVKIANQTWMAENLNYVTSSGSECYDNSTDSCNKYGRLYDWNTAKTVCLSGWHLPTNIEWETLATTAGGSDVGGKKLKTTSGWHNNGNGTDEYGFSALPGGTCDIGHSNWSNSGEHGHWWTATEGGEFGWVDYAYSRVLYADLDWVSPCANCHKRLGHSVRCVKDD